MREVLLDIISKNESSHWQPIIFFKYKDLYQWILNQTSYIEIDKSHSISERIFHIVKELNQRPICYCGQKTTFNSFNKGYATYCSVKCASNDPKIRDKCKDTCRKKYGSDNVFQSDSVKEKSKQTILARFGSDNVSKVKVIQDKKFDTMVKRYGGWSATSKEVREKYKKTCTERYGVSNVILDTNILDLRTKNILEKYVKYVPDFIEILGERKPNINQCLVKCNKCNKEKFIYWGTLIDYIERFPNQCPICISEEKGSSIEKELYDFICEIYKGQIIRNSRKILDSGKELDFYFPELNLAIEFNGIYWHSDQVNSDPFYHLNKLEECFRKSIRLIQIFEDEWINKKEIVKSKIENILGLAKHKLYARKCIIRELEYNTCSEFLDSNHIQGRDNSPIRLGLFYNDDLMSVMTFSRPNISKGGKIKEDKIWELNRYCTKNSLLITGAASKLMKYFIRKYNPRIVFSYADKRWSVGNMYAKLGFVLKYETKPNYWYIPPNQMKRVHRYNFRKSELIKEDISLKDKTEFEIMDDKGYLRVWDCGNLKYELKLSEQIVKDC